MAQYYQIQNFDELKQIYGGDVQVVHVASEDVSINSHNRTQQLLLQDDQILLNEGQVVYQTAASNPAQYQPQATTHYIIGDEIAQQQTQYPQQVQQQQHYQQEAQQQVHQQLQQEHQLQSIQQQTAQQPQQQPQTQQIYYTSTEQIIQQNNIQQQQSEMSHQQYQQQQQQIVHPQQHQQVQVYRMSTQQQQQSPQMQQQSQMLNNTHVIVQQPSGQPLLIQSPQQHQEIIMRQPMQQQHRIIYNTNRVLYSPQQQAQTQAILQQSSQHQPQHIQLQTTSMHTPQARLVQTRVIPQTQSSQQQPSQQGVVFHQIGATQSAQIVKPMQQQQPQQQQQQQHQQQQQQQQQQQHQQQQTQIQQSSQVITTNVSRGGVRAKTRGTMTGTPTLIARMPGVPTPRAAIRQPLSQVGAGQALKAPRPRNSTTASVAQRGRGAARGGRGGGNVVVGRSTQTVTPSTSGNMQIITPQHQSIMVQTKNVTTPSLAQPSPAKPVFRTTDSPQQQQQMQLVHQQRVQSMTPQATVRFRSPPVQVQATNAIQSPVPATSPATATSAATTNSNLELDLEDSIQAVVVKKDPQKPISTTPAISLGTTVTYYAKEDDENRCVRTPNSSSMTLAEYKKRNQSLSPLPPSVLSQVRALMRNSQKMSAQTAGQPVAPVPVARVAPLKPLEQTSSSVYQTSHNNYEIQTQHVLQNRSGQQMAEKDRNSAKMLVILVSGEQRLITFTLPRESCTVQDLLEQVGVPFDSNTTIQCVENPGANIDFVVTVGFSVQESASELISRAEQSLQMSRQQENNMAAAAAANNTATVSASALTNQNNALTSAAASNASYNSLPSTSNANIEENPKESAFTNNGSVATKAGDDIPRKVIQGFYAICQSCGFSGYDHAKCERCKRVFLEPPKRVPCVKATMGNISTNCSESMGIPRSVSDLIDKKRPNEMLGRGTKSGVPCSPGGRGRATSRGRSARSGRRMEAEPVILTLSSDEEEDGEASKGSVNNCLGTIASSGSFVSNKPLHFEVMMPDKDEAAIYADFKRGDITDLSNSTAKLSTSVRCKLVRIGSYRFEPPEPVTFTSKGVRIVGPLLSDPNEMFALHIYKQEVVKIIAHFSKTSDSMLCLYTLRTCAQYIKESLNSDTADTFFSPTGPYHLRKILLQFDAITDQARTVIKSIWSFFDEISEPDARDLLQRAADSDKQMSTNTNEESGPKTMQLSSSDTCQLLIYPPGKGGISINTEDYLCLASDQYLNDIIIDFYLKWVHKNVIPEHQKEKTFIFSTFFYKRLTTLTRHHNQHIDKEQKQTAAQKRHARVQNWTKNVNLFEKDYIIIPINEQSHWFLAIICFPRLKGPVTFDTNIPVDPQQIKKQRGKKVSLQIGNTTITPLSKRDGGSSNVLNEVCGVTDEDSERDEAEGDESDLASDESDFDTASATTSVGVPSTPPSTVVSAVDGHVQPIKQPLILIFDSLAGASRSRVVATLRDYLSCEYRIKQPEASQHIFNKDNMPGHCVKVPQQNNFTDCGLYLLQYVEQFFKDPIRDYRVPIKQLSNWFDTLTVTRKREDISKLLQSMMNEKNGPNLKILLPSIPLPTKDGELVETPEGYNVEFEEEEVDEEGNDEGERESVASAGGTDMDQTSEEINGKVIVKTTAATLVPTKGRKIVVKRRLQVGSNTDLSSLQTNSRSNMIKLRKID